MNYIEKGWIDNAKAVGHLKESLALAKKRQVISRINKAAYEKVLRERKTKMNSAMRAGDYGAVSRHHKIINITREQLSSEVISIQYNKVSIKGLVLRIEMESKKRDQFERAYRLVEAADKMEMANAKLMAKAYGGVKVADLQGFAL